MDHGRDERIRQRAHEIWEDEGRPHGKEKEHWERAEREVKAEGTTGRSPFAAEQENLPPLAEGPVVKKKRAAPSKADTTKAGAKAETTKAGTAKKKA